MCWCQGGGLLIEREGSDGSGGGGGNSDGGKVGGWWGRRWVLGDDGWGVRWKARWERMAVVAGGGRVMRW